MLGLTAGHYHTQQQQPIFDSLLELWQENLANNSEKTVPQNREHPLSVPEPPSATAVSARRALISFPVPCSQSSLISVAVVTLFSVFVDRE